MKTISETDAYRWEVDEARNQAVATFKRDPAGRREEEEAGLAALQVMCDSVTPGFSFLCDFRKMQATKAPDLFVAAQNMLIKAGVGKVAAVYNRKTFAKFQMATISKKLGLKVNVFFDIEEARAWLDQD